MSLPTSKITLGNTTISTKIKTDGLTFQQTRDALVHDLETITLALESGQPSGVLATLLGTTPDDAKATYDELNSLVGKINTNSDVTSLLDAINQFANKIR